MKKAFSFVELMIVIAVLGILAAIVLPEFQSYTTQAKGAAAKDDLRVLRGAIEFYAAQHRGVPPGYSNGDVTAVPSRMVFVWQLSRASNAAGQIAEPGTPGYNLGPYLETLPRNPFNDMMDITMIGNSENLPAEATGDLGWIYKAAAKTIRLDWPGTDTEGVRYYDY